MKEARRVTDPTGNTTKEARRAAGPTGNTTKQPRRVADPTGNTNKRRGGPPGPDRETKVSRVKGARKLRRMLQRLDPEITKEVKAVLRKGAEMIQRDAVALAPVRDGNLRAALADPKAIGVKSNGFKVEVGIRLKRQKRKAWYAHFVEFGTKGL